MKTSTFQCIALLAAALGGVGCKVDDGTTERASSTPNLPAGSSSSSGAPVNNDAADGGASSSGNNGGDAGNVCVPKCSPCSAGKPDGCGGTCTVDCAAGLGCNPNAECVACTKACGPNGTCVVGWEGGQHCKCAPGFYETISGCAPVAGTACAGVTCSGHGTCYSGPPIFGTECHCEGDYVQYGQACARRDAIRCIDADGSLKDKGTVRCNAAGTAFEVCRDGNADGKVEWVASGTPNCGTGKTCAQCLDAKCDNGDGSGGQACPTGTACMGMVHETPVYRCMPSCDCTNCGTCDPAQFKSWQRSCGSNDDNFSSATKACASPCPHASDGCLPYGQFAFCFPNEGCASAAPQ